MGGCLSKPGKIDPQSSNGQLIDNGKLNGKNHENSRANNLGLRTTKYTSFDRDVNERNSVVHPENLDNKPKAKTDNISHGGCSVAHALNKDSEPSNIQVSPQGRDGLSLPTKAVRFDIDFNDVEITAESKPRNFPRRLKVKDFKLLVDSWRGIRHWYRPANSLTMYLVVHFIWIFNFLRLTRNWKECHSSRQNNLERSKRWLNRREQR